MNLTSLRQLSKHLLGGDADMHCTLFATLKSLVSHVLQCPPNDLYAILQQRLGEKTVNYDEFMDLDGAVEVLTPDEAKEAKQLMHKEKAKADTITDFRSEYIEQRRKEVKASGGSRGGGGGQRGKSKRAVPAFKGLATITLGSPSQADAKRLVPPGAYIWRGNYGSGSWQIHIRPYPRKSVPWTIAGGGKEACRQVLEYAWRLYLQDNGFGEEDCPVAGIFVGGSGASAGSSAS